MSGLSNRILYLVAFLSGLAALSWQVVWQIKASLALGVSAWGTALTLMVTMAGFCIGSLAAGSFLRSRAVKNPLLICGVLEVLIGLSGLVLNPAFSLISRNDALVYAHSPELAPLIHVVSIAAAFGMATLCMGATLPVFGMIARQFSTSIATIYGLNTLGAALGALIAAIVFIPALGITGTIRVIAAINIAVGAFVVFYKPKSSGQAQQEAAAFPLEISWFKALLTVSATGFATLLLEVAWFRSLRAAFHSTTDAFAIMLAALLLALGLGAAVVPYLKLARVRLQSVLLCAGTLIFLSTPLIERFDRYVTFSYSDDAIVTMINWMSMTFLVIGPPIFFLGIALPWLMDSQINTRQWGRLYALNTFWSVIGALLGGWVFLPNIGFAASAWIAGGAVACVAVILSSGPGRLKALGVGAGAALIAITLQSSAGRDYAQGFYQEFRSNPGQMLESYEGPDVTTSVVRLKAGEVALIIDGFGAAHQLQYAINGIKPDNYFAWLGRLPMIAHPDPRQALVICFGTGQTANAVRQEQPEKLDIVDINPRVFQMAHYFTANQDVLHDPRVTPIIMDGRAYLRRVQKLYDVITLEPMPPTFSGVNALYSKEFYEDARSRLTENGVISQWLPFHLLTPYYAASIARTFQSVFPDAVLWIDPISAMGILLGSKDDALLNSIWPGYQQRPGITRPLTEADVRSNVLMDRDLLQRYGSLGAIITDDNQLLAYGTAAHQLNRVARRDAQNPSYVDALAFVREYQ